MIVKFGKEEIKLENVTSATTISSIVHFLLETTELESESIKLIATGKNLLAANGLPADETTTIGSLPKGIDTKLVLMGTKKSSLEQLSHCPPAPKNTTFNSNKTSQITVQSEYRFNSIVTLPGLPNEAKARAILTGKPSSQS